MLLSAFVAVAFSSIFVGAIRIASLPLPLARGYLACKFFSRSTIRRPVKLSKTALLLPGPRAALELLLLGCHHSPNLMFCEGLANACAQIPPESMSLEIVEHSFYIENKRRTLKSKTKLRLT